MSEVLAALLGALVGGLASAVGTWFLDRRRSSRDAAAHLYREVVPFLKRELEIGPKDVPGRTVELVGREFSVHGEHPREAFGHAVDSLDRWSTLANVELGRLASRFVERIDERRRFIESFDGAGDTTAPKLSIFDDPDYQRHTKDANDLLTAIDERARTFAKRR